MKNASTGQIKKNYTRVYIGRFDYLPYFNFGSKKLAIKKIANILGNQMKVANYKFIVKHLPHFSLFFKALGDKLVTHY